MFFVGAILRFECKVEEQHSITPVGSILHASEVLLRSGNGIDLTGIKVDSGNFSAINNKFKLRAATGSYSSSLD